MTKTRKQCIYKDDERGTYYFRVNFKNFLGKRKETMHRGFISIEEAEKARLDFLANHANDCTMPFTAVVNNYFEYCETEKNLRESTLYTRRCIVATHIVPFFGNKPINKIHQRDVLAWHHQLKLDESNFSDTYLYEISKTLIFIFKFAVNFLDLSDNVAEKCGYIGHAHTKHDDFWTESNFKIFVSSLTNKELNNQNHIRRKVDDFSLLVAFELLYYMGLRISEMLALTIDSIDFNNKTLQIDKQYQKKQFGPLKTKASYRTLPICDTVFTDLCILRNMLPNDTPHQRIFNRVNKSNLRRALDSTTKIANLQRIRIHDLRHSCAALLFAKGATALEAQKYLGHAKITTTQDYYGHVYPEDLSNLAHLLDK